MIDMTNTEIRSRIKELEAEQEEFPIGRQAENEELTDLMLLQEKMAVDAMTDLRCRQYDRRNPLDLAKLVARVMYAWPGGYALALVTMDGGLLCPKCVRAEWRNIVQAWLWRIGGSDTGWEPAGITNASEWEDDERVICDHCGDGFGD